MRQLRLVALVAGSGFFVACGNAVFATAISPETDASAADASPADSGTSDDAPSAVDGSSDAGAPFCLTLAPPPAFCADFDELSLRTTYVYGQQSNSLLRDVDQDAGADLKSMPTGLSLPSALVSETPAIATNGVELRARLHQKQSGSKSHFHVAFDFRLDAYDQQNIRLFELHAEGPGLVVQWEIASGGGELHGNSSAPVSMYSAPTSMPPAGPNWHHVEIDVMLATASATMSLVLDRNLPAKVNVKTTVSMATAVANFDIGLLATNPAAAARVSYDNVVYTED